MHDKPRHWSCHGALRLQPVTQCLVMLQSVQGLCRLECCQRLLHVLLCVELVVEAQHTLASCVEYICLAACATNNTNAKQHSALATLRNAKASGVNAAAAAEGNSVPAADGYQSQCASCTADKLNMRLLTVYTSMMQLHARGPSQQSMRHAPAENRSGLTHQAAGPACQP